jgi:hypothetical protein
MADSLSLPICFSFKAFKHSCHQCGNIHLASEPHVYTYVDEEHISPYLLDSITAQPFDEAVNLPCGHAFSRLALETALSYKAECPQCRQPVVVGKDNISVAYLLRGLSDSLIVQCPLQCASVSSSASSSVSSSASVTSTTSASSSLSSTTSASTTTSVCERSALPRHLLTCPNFVIRCPNPEATCSALMRRKDVMDHNCVNYWRNSAILIHKQRRCDNLYYSGKCLAQGLQQNEAEAFKCFKLAAQQGHLQALCTLAQSYELGELGVAKNIARAREMYQEASDRGSELARLKLVELSEVKLETSSC